MEMLIYYMYRGLFWFNLVITIAAIVAIITGAWHQIFITVVTGVLSYLVHREAEIQKQLLKKRGEWKQK